MAKASFILIVLLNICLIYGWPMKGDESGSGEGGETKGAPSEPNAVTRIVQALTRSEEKGKKKADNPIATHSKHDTWKSDLKSWKTRGKLPISKNKQSSPVECSPQWTSQPADYEYNVGKCIRLHAGKAGNSSQGEKFKSLVCFAIHTPTGVECVLKMTPTSEESLIPQIITEIRVMSELNIDGLVKFHHAFVGKMNNAKGERGDAIFLVTEMINQLNLYSWSRMNTIDESVLRPFVKTVVHAIQKLHDFHYMHRDIKPSNIVVHEDPATHTQTALLIDLGLAKRLADNDKPLIGSAGTIDYNSPEAIIHRRQNSAVDWWSLGVTIYWSMFRNLPCNMNDLRTQLIKAENNEQARMEIISEFEQSVHKAVEFVDKSHTTPSFKKFVIGLLQVDPQKRLGHVTKIVDAEWLQDEIFNHEY